MKDLDTVAFHKTTEKLTSILCNRTQSDAPQFFRVLTTYFFAKVASMMRVDIKGKGLDSVPINAYAINLGVSGLGKGKATRIIEKTVINQFKDTFLADTFPLTADENIAKIATHRASRLPDGNPEDELAKAEKEFKDLGVLLFSFDSATPAAIKQMRQKLLMSKCGSMNLEIDEIGSNLLGNKESLNVCLELYDMGEVKPKLVKNTAENIRGEDIEGRTPTNLLLFGTPTKLLDGGKVEDEILSFFDTGYGRRSLFAFYPVRPAMKKLSPQEELDALTNVDDAQFISDLSDILGDLANIANYKMVMKLEDKENLILIGYKQYCEARAEELKSHESILKTELAHRHFKAVKIAGAYAFIDGKDTISEDHLYSAFKMVEESGKAFKGILTRERNYVKLATFIAEFDGELTLADLEEDAPFYKGSAATKSQMLALATSWGYTHNVIIKRSFRDEIDFLEGEALKDTDLNKLTLSFSAKYGEDYKHTIAPFDKLHKLMTKTGLNWCNHAFLEQHRLKEKVIPGFNMIVLDVDDGVPWATAKLLLKPYKFFTYTTKRHQKLVDEVQYGDRFRVVIPISHELKMKDAEYKEFMNNIFEWLPFECDDCSNQQSKKFTTYKGQQEYNDGEVLDCLQFIPKTSKNSDRKQVIDSQHALDRVEKWFVNSSGNGNRNKQLLKYAMMLVDTGFSEDVISSKVLSLNSKFRDSLPEAEIITTILISAAKKVALRDAK